MRADTFITGASSGLGAAFLKAHPNAIGIGLADDAPEGCEGRYRKLDFLEKDPAHALDIWHHQTGTYWPKVLINCAGVNLLNWIRDVTQEDADTTFQVNVTASILLMGEVARRAHNHINPHDPSHIREHARIINIGSISGWTAQRCSILYNASKAALHMATRTAARELAPYITVMAMAPGCIEDTEMTDSVRRQVCELRGWSPEEARAYDMAYQPMGRYSDTEEMLKVLDHLAYETPPYMTGAVVPVPGGGA